MVREFERRPRLTQRSLQRIVQQSFLALFVMALSWALAAPVQAGVMTKESMGQAFPSPIIVGDKDAETPIWPIFKQDATATPLVGYVFESIDLVQTWV